MKRRFAMVGLVVALWVGPAFAQSCAMCYSTAKALNKDGQRAINRGIFVLLAPPVAFMTVGVGLALRYGKRRDAESLLRD
jgi:hypothetical protein